jgi:Lon protease-like protein
VAEVVPLFPLAQTVLFPGMVLPLHIFEERYRELVRTLLGRAGDGPRRFGVIAIRQGWEVGASGVQALHGVGTLAELRRVSRYPDGRYDIVTVGTDRFRLRGMVEAGRPYLVGEVELVPADPPGGPDAAVLVPGVSAVFRDYLAAVAAVRPDGANAVDPADMPTEASELSYLVAAAALLTLEDRQSLLAADGPAERLRAELRLLKRESTMLRTLRAVPVPLSELGTAPGPS